MLTAALAFAAAQASPTTGRDWWFFGQMAQPAPDRRVVFVDRNSMGRRGGEASLRAMMVFERVQEGGIRAFEVTWEFRCDQHEQRVRDGLFTLADGSMQPGYAPPDPWSPVAVESGTQSLMRAACADHLPAEAHALDRPPGAEAARIFGQR
jgi:hypothetical protein